MKRVIWRLAAAGLCVLALAAAATASLALRPAYVLICGDAAVGQLRDADGNLLQTLAFDARCQAAAGPLLPGDYQVQAGSRTVRFTLRTNAAVSRVSGDGWSDGEILYLDDPVPGQLTVYFDGRWQWTLEGERADECAPDLEEGVCVFRDLPLGSYVLRGGEQDLPILLTKQEPEWVLDLRKREFSVTGPLG